VLPGPVKVDLVFDRPPRQQPPWRVTAETLAAVDAHFWDFTLWLASKRLRGRDDVLAFLLPNVLTPHLLRPLGVERTPETIEQAVALYLAARAAAEARLGVRVPRELGREVQRVLPELAPALVHELVAPHVRSVEAVGSRAAGTATAASDWDFLVDLDEPGDLPRLTAPVDALGALWDPLSPHRLWMLVLPGPVKVDLVVDRPHALEPPWALSAETLPAIDVHFWDWTLWLTSKRAKGDDDLVRAQLALQQSYLLAALGVRSVPETLERAVALYEAARDAAEERLGVRVPRALAGEVRRLLSIEATSG
jgi:predicted nucleotidyltransferase